MTRSQTSPREPGGMKPEVEAPQDHEWGEDQRMMARMQFGQGENPTESTRGQGRERRENSARTPPEIVRASRGLMTIPRMSSEIIDFASLANSNEPRAEFENRPAARPFIF